MKKISKEQLKALVLTFITCLTVTGVAHNHNVERRKNNAETISVSLDIEDEEEVIKNSPSPTPTEMVIETETPIPEETVMDMDNNTDISDTDKSDNTNDDNQIDSDNNTNDNENVILWDNFGYINEECLIYDDNFNPRDTIGVYQKVLRVNESDGFIYSLFEDGSYGYIESYYFTPIENTYIEVDIEDQMLYFYIDNELVLSSSIVTGKDDTPTYCGYFHIFYKEYDAVLTSYTYGYETPVTYWMAFDGNIGFHDAWWRDNFGGQIYQLDGSHGCVNLPYNIAEYLFENTWTNYDDGTKVLVHK